MKKSLSLLWCILVLSSCQKDEPTQHISIGREYFPFSENKTLIYEVDSIYFDDFTRSSDTFSFEEKHQWFFLKIDEEQDSLFEIHVSRKMTNSSDFVFHHRAQAKQNNYRTVEFDGNNPVVTLVFPLKDNETWNANQFNGLGERLFTYEHTRKDTVILGNTIRSTRVNRTYEVVPWAPLDTFLERKIEWVSYQYGEGPYYHYYMDVKAKGITGQESDTPVDSGVVVIKVLK